MRRRVPSVIGLLWLALACRGPNVPDEPSSNAVAEVDVPAAPATTQSAALASDPAPLEVVIGSERGLEAYDLEGRLLRRISSEVSLFPRWLDETTVLVLRSDGDLGRGFRVEQVDLTSGQRRPAFRIPPTTCRGEPPSEPLELHEASDFAVDVDRELVCLRLFDGPPVLASFGVLWQFHLGDGLVERWLLPITDDCGVANQQARPEAFCAGPPEFEREPDATSFRFRQQDGAVVLSSDRAELLVTGYALEAVSPSRRWVLLYGEMSEGDYVHRRLLLLDMKAGEVFPIPKAGTRWPEPLARVGTDAAVHPPHEDTTNVVGESDVRWFGKNEASELLVVDEALVRPGRLIFRPGGQVVR